jgi:arylsulfatase A-like enzyme
LSEGKGWDREGGVRVCQLARWPARLPAGTTSAVPMQSCDLYPTFLDAAGLPLRPDQHRDGLSLLPTLCGTGSLPDRSLFWHFPHYGNQGGQPAAWVLRDGWKLIHRYESGRDELYHQQSDIGETRDRIAERSDLAHSLRRELAAWQAEVEAHHPVPDPDYDRLAALVPQIPNNASV